MLTGITGFLDENGLRIEKKLGKGWSSNVFLVRKGKGQPLVLKAERGKVQRFRMVEREAENLGKVNALGIGPKLVKADREKRVVLMEFVDGSPLSEWLLAGSPSKREVESVAMELLRQGEALDGAGIDHGQLAGKGTNILVAYRKGKPVPVIIDWEKGSSERKCHNRNSLEAFLLRNPHGAVAARVRKVLGKGAEKLCCKEKR